MTLICNICNFAIFFKKNEIVLQSSALIDVTNERNRLAGWLV